MRPGRLVVVTGAAGFIGSHVCEALVAEGHRVVGVDDGSGGAPPENLGGLAGDPRFDLVRASVAGAPARRALAGANAAIHLAARPGVRDADPAGQRRATLDAAVALLDGARAADVRRIVVASSSSVYGQASGPVAETARLAPRSPYGRAKVEVERMCRASGAGPVLLRYFSVYGPRQRADMAFARFIAAATGGPAAPLHGDGSQVRDFTAVADAAHATLLALRFGRPGAAYNVAGGRPVRLAEALVALAAVLHRPVPVAAGPPHPADVARTHADLRRARAELGYRPAVALADGLAEQALWARRYLGGGSDSKARATAGAFSDARRSASV